MGVQLGFMGVQLGGKGHLGRFTGLRLRCADWRAAAGGCHCASLMMKRRAAAGAVRPCLRPDPGSPPSPFPQVTCLDRPGRPVLPPLFACGMRARPALAVLTWSGDGSPVWGCTTTSGVQVPPRTHGGLKSLGTQAPGFGGCLRARPRHRARAPLDPRASNAVTSTWRECRHDHLDTAPLNQLGQGNDAQRPGSSNPAPFKPGSASTSPSRSAVRLSLCRTPTRR